MADYKLIEAGGVYDNVGLVTITPVDTDAWQTYQAWLDAGNTPDPWDAVPLQPITGGSPTLEANGVASVTFTGIINATDLTILSPPETGLNYSYSETITDGEYVFSTLTPGVYGFTFITPGYQDYNYIITASLT